jgi:glutathione synthase/RimK-type ligase-like ATP-grasp enzyme
MGKKRIVMFFGKKRREPDPFWDFGEKRSVYYDFFERGLKSGAAVFLANGRESYKEGLVFVDVLEYQGNQVFKKNKKEVVADVVYDRSGGIFFPNKEVSSKVLNGIEFKKLCSDKFAMYEFLGEENMKKTYSVEGLERLREVLLEINSSAKYFLKPKNGLGGKGIHFGYPGELANVELSGNSEYVLQEFVNTSSGIKNIVKGLHDLRVVFVNGKIVWSHVRSPQKGSFLSNVSQGGAILEIDPEKIPVKILEKANLIQDKIERKYGKVIFSIDFGVEDGVPFVFELNDQIGFPTEKMNSKNLFIDELYNVLLSKI